MTMPRFRWLCAFIIAIGILLLIKVFYEAWNDMLVATIFTQEQADSNPALYSFYAFCLSLAIPYHVISIGLILQRKWLSHTWKKIALFAIVTSGCWLGTSVAIQAIIAS